MSFAVRGVRTSLACKIQYLPCPYVLNAGMDKMREVNEKNRKRKLAKHKKLPNNTIIEIDNCSSMEILKLQKNPAQFAEKEQIAFVYGKGKASLFLDIF